MRAFLAVFAFAVPVCGRLPDIQVRLLSRESREGEPDSSVGGSIAQVRWSVNRTRRCEFVDVFWHMEGESPSTLVAESCASNIPNTGEYELQLPKVSLSGPYVLRLQCHSPFWKRRNRISINGFFYSTLEDHEIFHRGDHCQRSNRSIPSGWQVSPDDGRVHETVVGAYPWSTHILVLSSGKGYAVKHGVRIQDKAYKAGQEISLTELGKTAHDVWGYFDMSTNSYKSLQCASLLSIRTKEPAVSLHWPKSSSVNIYSPQCQTQAYDARSDCGFSGITPAECRQRGCCFDRRSASAPQCYHLRREPSLPELLGRISMTTEQEEGKLSAPPNVPKRLKEGDIVLGVLSETVKDPSGNYLHGAALTGKVTLAAAAFCFFNSWLVEGVVIGCFHLCIMLRQEMAARKISEEKLRKQEETSMRLKTLRRWMLRASEFSKAKLSATTAPEGGTACACCLVMTPQVVMLTCKHQCICAPCMHSLVLKRLGEGLPLQCLQCQIEISDAFAPTIMGAPVPVSTGD